MTNVKIMIDKPVFGIPILSSNKKIPFIKNPNILAIGPNILPEF